MASVSPEPAHVAPPTIPDDWHYPVAVGTGHAKVQQYLAVTEDLLRSLWVARTALDNHHGTFVTEAGDEVSRHFEDFCDEIGMAPSVAMRWLRKYEDRLLSLPPGADVSSGEGPEDDESRPSVDDIARRVLAGLRTRASASTDGSRGTFAEILTLEDASLFLRCDVAFLRAQVEAGGIRAYRLADELRFVRSELVDWLTSLPNTSRKDGETRVRGDGPHDQQASEERGGDPRAGGHSKAGQQPSHTLGRRAGRIGRGAKLSGRQRQTVKDRILGELRKGTGITEAVQLSGIAWATFHNWRKRDQAFSDAITEIRGW